MARDTTALLHRALEAAEQWEAAPSGSPDQQRAAEVATGSIVLLHHELHEGGQLPAAWANAQPPASSPISGAGA
jgi:hypothetical protein